MTKNENEILAAVDESEILTNTQKDIIRAYFNGAFQAAYNAATNTHGGSTFSASPGGDVDIWQVAYNQMIQYIQIGTMLGPDVFLEK